MIKTTPALATPIQMDDNNHESNDDLIVYDSPPPRVSTYARALRKIAFALALSTLVVLLGVLLILLALPFRYKWEAKQYTIVFIEWMSAITFLCLIFVLANSKIPSFFKAMADIIFTWGIICCLIDFMNEFPHYEWCYEWGKTTPVFPQCVQWRLILTIMMGVSSGFAIILGAIFVLLLLLRIYKFFSSPYWRQICTKLPSGEISFTLRFNSANRNSNSQDVIQEARSAPTGQGPVRI